MRSTKPVLWVLLVFAAITLLGFRHWSEVKGGRTVAKVHDGDTIRLDDGTKVRLLGVDAPEVDSPYRVGEPGGEGSRDYLKALVEGREVTIKVGPEPKDRYGRTLAMVYLGDVLVNGRIIRDGWARAYRRFDYPHKDLFRAYEEEARARGIGIWAAPGGGGPARKFRKKTRQTPVSETGPGASRRSGTEGLMGSLPAKGSPQAGSRLTGSRPLPAAPQPGGPAAS